MESKYLLPCNCGKKIVVEPGQAGQSIRCACGAELEVPTLMALRRLDPAEPEHQQPGQAGPRPAAASTGWGIRQGIVFFGSIVTLIGLIVATYLFVTRPQLPKREQIRPRINSLSPLASRRVWFEIRSQGPDIYLKWDAEGFEGRLFRYRLSLGVALAVALGGVAIAATALLQGHPGAQDDAESVDPPED